MRKAFFLAFSLASMIFAQGAMAADYGSAADKARFNARASSRALGRFVLVRPLM